MSKLHKFIIDKWNTDGHGPDRWSELSEEEKVEFAYLVGSRWEALPKDVEEEQNAAIKEGEK
jgi:hypothetical protein